MNSNWDLEGGKERMTHVSLHVDETKSLADVVAYDDYVWVEQLPVIGTRGVRKFQTVLFVV